MFFNLAQSSLLWCLPGISSDIWDPSVKPTCALGYLADVCNAMEWICQEIAWKRVEPGTMDSWRLLQSLYTFSSDHRPPLKYTASCLHIMCYITDSMYTAMQAPTAFPEALPTESCKNAIFLSSMNEMLCPFIWLFSFRDYQNLGLISLTDHSYFPSYNVDFILLCPVSSYTYLSFPLQLFI